MGKILFRRIGGRIVPIVNGVPRVLKADTQKSIEGIRGFRAGLRTEGTSKIKKHRQLLGKLHKEFTYNSKKIGKALGKLGKKK